MIRELDHQPEDKNQKVLFETPKPIVVMDAGIATKENVSWLKNNNYRYLVVSRKRYREFSEDAVVVKKDRDYTVKAYKKINEETDEIELYCHSTQREKKDRAIMNRFTTRYEDALKKLDAGLHKKGCIKNITIRKQVWFPAICLFLYLHIILSIQFGINSKGKAFAKVGLI